MWTTIAVIASLRKVVGGDVGGDYPVGVTDFGGEVRRALDRRGLSVRAAARMLHYDHAFLSRVLRGRQRPSTKLVAALEDLLGDALGDEQVAWLDRLTWVADKPRAIDQPAVDVLSGMLADLRRLEDSLGAQLVLPTANTHVSLMRRLVVEARGPMRPAVVSLGSQYAQFSGWLLSATDQYDGAGHAYELAAEWAREVADADMMATAVNMRGTNRWMLGDVPKMLALSETALSIKLTSPGVRAMAAQQAARAHAMLGNADMTDRLLDVAERFVMKATEHPDSQPPWMYFFSTDYLALQRGRAYVYLGRHRRAAEHLESGFAALPPEVQQSAWTRSYLNDLEKARVH